MWLRVLAAGFGVWTAGIAQAQTSSSDIGYPSPQAALKALYARRPDVQFSLQND
jgi:hypothetical protein